MTTEEFDAMAERRDAAVDDANKALNFVRIDALILFREVADLRLACLQLELIGSRVGLWRIHNFGLQSQMRNALQICEEAGEVAKVVGKTDEGIRAETRGDLADELRDVILAVCGMAAAERIDLAEVVERRLQRMESLDFTKNSETG